MSKTVLAFDIYGTILDPSSMQGHLAEIFPDSAATLTSLWRRYQLEYTWRANSQENYEPFERITKKALAHAILECGEQPTPEAMHDIMQKYETLAMFPDVEKTLTKLRASDKLDLYMFSNGSHVTLKNARSTHDILSVIFPKDKIVTVDDVKSYKPSRVSYTHMLKTADKLDCPHEVILVSSNPFDICGARSMGMRAAWINRSTTAKWWDQLGEGPTWTLKSFSELAKLVSS